MAIQEKANQVLKEAGALRSGHFLLSSGLHSERYCQAAALFENPAMGARIARLMGEIVPRDLGVDTVLAPAIGGILWGYELSRELGVRFLFAEREAGGPFHLKRGFSLAKGEQILLAEDVITTGKSVSELKPLAARAGAQVTGFAAIADRSQGNFRPAEPLFALTELKFETYSPGACPLCEKGIALEKPGSREFLVQNGKDGEKQAFRS